MREVRVLALLGAAAALAIAACGGGEDEDGVQAPRLPSAARTALFGIYDWEVNVVGPRGRVEPDNTGVTESPAPPAEARRRMAKAPGAILIRDDRVDSARRLAQRIESAAG